MLTESLSTCESGQQHVVILVRNTGLSQLDQEITCGNPGTKYRCSSYQHVRQRGRRGFRRPRFAAHGRGVDREAVAAALARIDKRRRYVRPTSEAGR